MTNPNVIVMVIVIVAQAMDFLLQIILILAVLAGFGGYNGRAGQLFSAIKARPAASFFGHLEPAKRIVFPYLLKGASAFDETEFTAKSVIVMDEGTGRVLFAKDPNLTRPLASLTKLMSALVWFDIDGDLNKTVEISADDYREGSIPYFIAGDKVKTRDLLYAALIASSNSAVSALVRSTGLAEEKFVRLMNAKGRELGMGKTVFSDPVGLSAQNQSAAADLFILAREAFYNREISRATELLSYEFRPAGMGAVRVVKNTNRLLVSSLNNGNYKIIGGKTGYIEESDYNLILKTYNKEKDKNIIVVILGSSDKNLRFAEAAKIIEWTYKNYMWKI